MKVKYLEERIFTDWLKRNKLIGLIEKKLLGLLVPMDLVIQEYNGDMLLTKDIFRRILLDWKIASYPRIY